MIATTDQKDQNDQFTHTEQHHATAQCYHCGEDCQEETILLEDKPFCCEGCKMVYEILNTNDLCQFYDIENNAGVSLKGQSKARYAWLDDEEVAHQLIDYQDEQTTKVSLQVPQIHCASCIWLLENLYKLNDAVTQSRVNFMKKEVYISYDHHKSSLRNIVELLALIGYAPHIQLNQLDEKKTAVDRKLIYQIGLAGFAFGNIMLLSFPEYLGLTGEQFQTVFGYLNIAIIIPTILYSAQHYLKSAWFGLRQGDLNIDVPISLGILTLFGRSVFEIVTQTGAGYLDSLAGLILFLLAGRWFQQKTYHHLSFERDYKSYFPVAATVLQEDFDDNNAANNPNDIKNSTSVALNKLEIGDRILVRNQEIVPADGILVAGNARIDYSFVTGEAAPITKKIGDKIYAGGRQIGTGIEILTTKKVNQSYLVQLWNEDAFQKTSTPHASALANKVGKYFTFAIVGIAVAALLYWLPQDVGVAVNVFTAVLIIACPCAVALSIPFTLGNMLRLLAQRGFYAKNTEVMEHLQKANAIVFDKTGTLTDTSRFDVHYTEITNPLNDKELAMIAQLTRQSQHPLSKAISEHLRHLPHTHIYNVSLPPLTHFEEATGRGLQGQFGAHYIKIGSAAFVATKVEPVQRSGVVFICIDDVVRGYFGIVPSYREGLEELMAHFKDANNVGEVHLISGDNDQERDRLRAFFADEHLHFQQSPKQKLDYIKALQDNGKTVIMLGDGLNDAGALQQSDIGIVITENTNNFTPACDAILDAQKFQTLPSILATAQKSVQLVYWAYALAFVYNVIGLSFAVQGLLSPLVAAILMPLSSVTIVAFGVLSSYLLANLERGGETIRKAD